MENKNLFEQRRDLLLLMRESVNSREEFTYIQAELTALSSYPQPEVSRWNF